MKKTFKPIKGDIIYGRTETDAIHPIVYLEELNLGGVLNDDFIGLMLTRSSCFRDNILLSKDHIKERDKDGKPFKFQHHKDTHFVKMKFIKKGSWSPFRKVGELTTSGLEFVVEATNGLSEVDFDDYARR